LALSAHWATGALMALLRTRYLTNLLINIGLVSICGWCTMQRSPLRTQMMTDVLLMWFANVVM
jgi:hypothetical protein